MASVYGDLHIYVRFGEVLERNFLKKNSGLTPKGGGDLLFFDLFYKKISSQCHEQPHSGMQAGIKAVASNAIYIHCHAHRLNLVLGDCI